MNCTKVKRQGEAAAIINSQNRVLLEVFQDVEKLKDPMRYKYSTFDIYFGTDIAEIRLIAIALFKTYRQGQQTVTFELRSHQKLHK
jgi:hypothetical protein